MLDRNQRFMHKMFFHLTQRQQIGNESAYQHLGYRNNISRKKCCVCFFYLVVTVLPDSFRGIGARRNSVENQESGHAPSSGPEVKNGKK